MEQLIRAAVWGRGDADQAGDAETPDDVASALANLGLKEI